MPRLCHLRSLFFAITVFASGSGASVHAHYAHAPLSAWRTTTFAPGQAAGIFFEPAAPVALEFSVENVAADSISLDRYVVRVARTRSLVGNPQSIWDSPYKNVELIGEWPLRSLASNSPGELSPGRVLKLSLSATTGKYGHFSVMIALRGGAVDDGYRAAAFAVVYPPAKGPKPESYFLATADDTMTRGESTDFSIPERYGIKWLRLPITPRFSADGQFDWTIPDRLAAALRRHGLLSLNDISTWAGPLPMIGGKPITYAWGRKVNLIPRPEDFPLFGQQVEQVIKRYGDVSPAAYLRNEPWEKGSITFYHGTGHYYGEWLKVASTAARRASPDFPILAADAITNFEDNIQMRGLTDYVDITSHHADLEASRGAVQSAVLGKRAWETEDWLSHYDAYLIANLTMKIAHGFEKSNPGDPGLYQTQPGHNGHPDWRFVPNSSIALPAPAGQAVSTWLHFIEGVKFTREISPSHLPWMFLFESAADAPAKHAAVVIGRIKAYGYGYHEAHGDVAWPAVTAFGKLQVADTDRALSVYDFSGNAIARDARGGFEIPLNEEAHYVISTRGASDVEAKLRAARAEYAGNTLQATLLDFTQPLEKKPAVRVSVRNNAQATTDAEVKLTPPTGWRLVAPTQSLAALKPGESRELAFEVAETAEVAANRYPFSVEVKSPTGGLRFTENLHVAIFRRGTVNVDGDLSDWEKIGALPVTVSSGAAAPDAVEKYWFPFMNLPAGHAGGTQVRFAGAWDDDYFYLCAEVQDAEAHYRPSMREGIYFTQHEAPLDFLYWGVTPEFVSTAGDGLKIAFDIHRAGEKNDPWLPPEAQKKVDARFEALSADYEYDLYLGAKNRLAESYATVRDRHLARIANPPDDNYRKPNPPFEDPRFVIEGEPQPEVWRLMAPGVPRHNYYPFSNRLERDQGLVPRATLVVKREGALWRYEAAIPWSELAEVKPVVGREVRFSFYVLNDGKRSAAWASGRSASGGRSQTIHPTWYRADAIETVWSFQDFAR
ncbi:hypothetical protein [Oleiharenicola lentus]|uniref:hypothetical protein n=1 Tax=Oleiharenicola lentus TaxID=2508720 RepID=UPI003F67CCC6